MSLIPPNLKLLAKRPESLFVVVRYLAAALTACEALFFARALGPQTFGEYALIQQLVMLMTIGALGHPAGYVYAYFRERESDLDIYYLSGAIAQYVAGGLVASIILVCWRPFYLFSVALYFLQIPYLITEPMLRVRNRFAFTAVGRGLASIFSLAAGLLLFQRGQGRLGINAAIAAVLLGTLLGYAIYYYLIHRSGYLELHPAAVLRGLWNKEHWRHFGRRILSPGIPLNASSAILIAFNNAPRLFIERYQPAVALSVYSLAWTLSQGAMLMLSSLNLVSAIQVGELMNNSPEKVRDELRAQLLRTGLIGTVSLASLVLLSTVLSHTIYRDYPDLVIITLFLNSGYLVMNIVGSVMGYLFYERKTIQMNCGYGFALLLCVAVNWVLGRAHVWYGYQVISSSLILAALNVWFLFLIYRAVGRRKESFMDAVHAV